jgi:hypothetical protein
VPCADGSAALGSSDAGADGVSDGVSEGAADAEELDEGRGDEVEPGNE